MVEPYDIIFLGPHGPNAVFYYRCLLPAHALGASYCAVYGAQWPKVSWATGLIQPRKEGAVAQSAKPDLNNYKIVVITQPYGPGWLKLIQDLRKEGKVVLFEVDDYLHGIQEKTDHDYRNAFDREMLDKFEACMRASSGLLCSTQFIADRYQDFNERVFVCRNGLDLGRYDLIRPARKSINIGWAGATGHTDAILPWLQGIGDIMRRREDVNLVTIGLNYADFYKHTFKERTLSIPWASIEQYPGAMTMFDVAIAPAGKGTWYQGKSDLRFLEAGVLGVPVVADHQVYHTIRHGETGFKARNPREAMMYLDRLIEEPDLRATIGRQAKEYVVNERSIHVVAQDWRSAFEEMIPE